MPSYINPQQIFPKRLGVMNGNTLVLEYYNLGKDKFKKHLMPFETQNQTKTVVEQIFKNPKHIPFLKKVNPKHITAVLQGQKIGFKGSPPQNNFEQFYQPKDNQIVIEKRKFVKEKQSYHQQNKQPEPIFQESNKLAEKTFQKIQTPKANQPEEYYNQQFEDFQISASIDKGSNLTSNFSKILSQNQEKSSVSKSQSIKPESEKQIKKQKKEKQVFQEILQQYEDDFEFLDQDARSKKQKKQKKEKGKSKSKSKDKKTKKQKEGKKQAGTKKQSQNKQVQQEFQFL